MNMARYRHIFQLNDDPPDNLANFKKHTRSKLRQDPDPVNPDDDDENDDPDTLIEII